MGIRGEMSVEKLLLAVLAVLVLVVSIFMVASGYVPNIEKLELMLDDVIRGLGFVEDVYVNENCNTPFLREIEGGSEVLRILDIDEKIVKFVFCDYNRMCTFEGAGLNLYKSFEGDFFKLEGGVWNSYDSFFVGNFEDIKRDFEFYHAGVDFLEGVKVDNIYDLKRYYDSGVSGRLVLYGDGEGWGNPVYATWENGEWRVAEALSEDSAVEDGWIAEGDKMVQKVLWGSFTRSRKVYYQGDDIDLALGNFTEQVWSKGFFGNDDEVTWRVISPEKADVFYLRSEDNEGASIGGLISAPEGEPDVSFNNKYNSIVAAEHGDKYDANINGLRADYDPWIRTKVYGSSSSAYGPAQLTKGLVEEYLRNKRVSWTAEELDYLNRFVKQGELFLRWGGSDMPANKKDPVTGKDVSRYDYGGSGDLNSEEDRALYERVCGKMLDEIYERRNGDLTMMWREWRFGKEGAMDFEKNKDVRYGKMVEIAWPLGIEKSREKDDGNYNEVDSEVDVVNLKIEVEKIISRLVWGTRMNDGDADKLKGLMKGKNLKVGDKSYDLSVEESGVFPIIVFENSEGRFGFVSDGDARVNSELLRGVKLRYFPIKLAEFRNGGWEDLGNEEYYRLYEKDFEGVYRASVLAEFLKKKCK